MSERERAPRERCEYPSCPSFARIGERFCYAHADTPELDPFDGDDATLTYAQRVALRDQLAKEERRREFERRLETGDYKQIYGARAAKLIEQAAKQAGMEDERGALRVTLAMLVADLEDPDIDRRDTARAIATITRAATLVDRGQRAASGELVASIQDAMLEILGEIDGGQE